MNWAFRTMVVIAAHAAVARAIAAALSPAGRDMFIIALVPADGPADAAATHYVSTGKINPQFAALLDLNDAQALYDASVSGAAAQGLPVTWTVEDCAGLLAESDVSAEEPFAAFARVGLVLVQEDA